MSHQRFLRRWAWLRLLRLTPLLARQYLQPVKCFAILGQLAERRLDYGDLYFQSSYHESWAAIDLAHAVFKP
ncbi:hypothetical protein ACN56_14965 [Escherichia coli]|nr:hypothetical protein ACN56_14965 [Escherichia coli]